MKGAPCDLTKRINSLRFLMIRAGRQNGLGSQEVLRYSEELDKLIMEFQLRHR
ncbi:aspartyl-phosphate phosphatase Spo0E family protein [Domibacillus antri]|uniref:aspartyl-phosphate phosphatase Spo0E family protein n=1 Tax=Domibacillus antri TaxID=1714264 RepID=UPI00318344F6